MRFLIVSHFFAAHGGGIERVAAHMGRNLVKQGHEVEWAASSADSPSDEQGVAPVLLPCINPTEAVIGLPMPIPGPRALARLWKAVGRAEAVIIHDALYCTSIFAMAMAKMRRKPVILVQHVAEIAFANSLMRGLMAVANQLVTRPMLRIADQVIFISDTVRSFFASSPMRRPALLQFNGVDIALFNPNHGERDHSASPQAACRSGDSPLIAFVGRFVEKKGLGIIRALAHLRPDTHFALAGSGPIDPRQWNLPNVHLLGSLQPPEVAALFRSADCLLLPSVGEGYPLVIQEAMATGLPVICGDESALADPGASRWLHGVRIDLQDVDGSARRVADALDRLNIDERERQAMACYAGEHYSWKAFASGLGELGQILAR